MSLLGALNALTAATERPQTAPQAPMAALLAEMAAMQRPQLRQGESPISGLLAAGAAQRALPAGRTPLGLPQKAGLTVEEMAAAAAQQEAAAAEQERAAKENAAAAEAMDALAAKELAPGQRASNRAGYAAAYEALGYTVAKGANRENRLYGAGGVPGTSNYGYSSAAEMAAAQEATKASAGGGGGGFPPWLIPLLWGHSPGGGGGGRGWMGNLLTGGGLLAGMGSLGSFAGFGPEHLLLTLGGIAGSGVAALGGGSLLAGGALAKMGVGVGSDMAVATSASADTKSIYTALAELRKAEAIYGKQSIPAITSRKELQYLLHQGLQDTAGVKAEMKLAEEVETLNNKWDKETSGARVQYAKLASEALPVANAYIPLVNEAAQQNFAASAKALKPMLAWLEGPEVMGMFRKLETEFFAEIPTGIHAADEGLHFLGHTIMDLSPLTGTLLGSLNKLFTRLNEPS
ncbi:MAG: hypothetical protein WAU69_03080, partial [Solirubrobacteraceae bacterium]